MNRYRCRTCSWTGELPEDAVLVIDGKVPMYRFRGSTHHLSPIRKITESQHNSWHRIKKNILCTFCYPEPKDHDLKQTESQPTPQTEATTSQIDPEQDNHFGGSGDDLPELHQQEDPPVPEDLIEEASPGMTSMSAAFNKLFRQQEEEDWRDDSTAKF
jgi:hypothetical protein